MKDNLSENTKRNNPELSKFHWNDPLLFENSIGEDERMLRDGARAFAAEKLKPRVVEAYESEHFDPDIFRSPWLVPNLPVCAVSDTLRPSSLV